jgi:hypothetical protein
MESTMKIVRCVSCEGYGWFTDEFTGETADCDWCGGVGYVYQEEGVDRRIPESDFGRVADTLEKLDVERMREMGYKGEPKKPWEQAVRRGTSLGEQKPPQTLPDEDE